MGRPTKKGSAPWSVELARSTDGGRHFTLRQVTGTIHLGELCTHGSGCASDGSRNLLDDFGLAISPTTGLDSISYTDDMPTGAPGKAFTAFTTEVPDSTPGGGSTGRSGGSSPEAGGGNSGGTGPSLATTGASPLIAGVGLLFAIAGLAVRRRTTA
jgi:hypothetical protein